MGRGEGGGEEGRRGRRSGMRFCFGWGAGGIEKGRVGRVWEGLIHLVGGGACSWVLRVGSGVEGGMLMICSLGIV